MTEPANVPARWTSFPRRSGELPASVLVNLWYHDHAPLSGAPVLYRVVLEILDPGEHGMGTAADAERLFVAEDPVVQAAPSLGLHYTGRWRSAGHWELLLYGPGGREAELRSLVAGTCDAEHRGFEVLWREDPDWEGFGEVLRPDPSALLWIANRDAVASLQDADDDLVARGVEHWLRFPSAAAADEFAATAGAQGFEQVRRLDGDDPDHRPGVRLSRRSSVQLPEIHDVALDLSDLARQHGGQYDGWEVPTTPPGSGPGLAATAGAPHRSGGDRTSGGDREDRSRGRSRRQRRGRARSFELGRVFVVPLLGGGYGYGYVTYHDVSWLALANVVDVLGTAPQVPTGIERAPLIIEDLKLGGVEFTLTPAMQRTCGPRWVFTDRRVDPVPGPTHRYFAMPRATPPLVVDLYRQHEDRPATAEDLRTLPNLGIDFPPVTTNRVEIALKRLDVSPWDYLEEMTDGPE